MASKIEESKRNVEDEVNKLEMQTQGYIKELTTDESVVCQFFGGATIRKETNKEHLIELYMFITQVIRQGDILDFAFPGIEMKSKDDMCNHFVEKVWDILPNFLKQIDFYPTKDKLLEHCKNDDSEINLFKFVVARAQTIILPILEKNERIMHEFIVYGKTGDGKSTLIKTIASVLNLMNADSKDISDIIINDNKPGTTIVSKQIKFNIGTMMLAVRDMPGTVDTEEERCHSNLIKQIRDTGAKIDSILYTINVGHSCRPGSTNDDISTLETLALAFKSEGLKVWERVIICLTKMNEFTTLDPQKPKFRSDFDDEELSDYLDELNDYMLEYVEKMNERIKTTKEIFKKNWYNLFDPKTGVYEKKSEDEMNATFQKINFVICGTVQKKSVRNDDKADKKKNTFIGSTILDIPDFDLIPNIPNISEENKEKYDKINAKISSKSLIKSSNWVNNLYSRIVECSSLDFQINCSQANHLAIQKREKENKGKNIKSDSKRRATVDDIRMDNKAKQKIKNGVSEVINKRMPNNVVFDSVCTGAGGVIVGGTIFVSFAIVWATALGVVGGGYGGYKLAQMAY